VIVGADVGVAASAGIELNRIEFNWIQ
jgi:hypothetical protein